MVRVKENFAPRNAVSCAGAPAVNSGKEILETFSFPAVFASLSRAASKMMFLLLAFFIVQEGRAQEYFDNIATAGQVIPGVRAETKKANQSQVVWYGGAWWGVFRPTNSGATWLVYKYQNDQWTASADTGINSGAEADAHVDEANGKLYVLVATSAQRVSRFSYSGGNWTRDSGFPTGQLDINPAPSSDDPACLTRALNGDLFIFWVGGGNLSGLRSTNQGVSWTGPFTITSSAGSALTDAIGFRYLSTNYTGVFVGEGDGTKRFLFRRLADGADPTNQGNWVAEDLPFIPALDGDDHVNIVRDADHNLYAIGKWGSSNKFYLFKRNRTNGQWSYVSIEPDFGTRPSLAIDEDNNSLVIIGTVRGSGEPNKIQYTVLDKDNLHNVIGMSAWSPAIENGSDTFSEATVSYQILGNSSNLMVCAEKTNSPTAVWYNLLDLSDISLPVFMAFFNATTDGERINLEWATHSEVNNWEWILLRRDGEEGEFRELTRMPGSGSTNSLTRYAYADGMVQPETVYYYRLANVDYDGTIHHYPQTVKASLTPPAIASGPADGFMLYPNYPNPFNGQTTIRFEIGQAASTSLEIFDLSGRRVRELFSGYLSPGSYNYTWDGRDDHNENVASGVYFLKFTAGNYSRGKRMVLSR